MKTQHFTIDFLLNSAEIEYFDGLLARTQIKHELKISEFGDLQPAGQELFWYVITAELGALEILISALVTENTMLLTRVKPGFPSRIRTFSPHHPGAFPE